VGTITESELKKVKLVCEIAATEERGDGVDLKNFPPAHFV
jgi:hypothetical protein